MYWLRLVSLYTLMLIGTTMSCPTNCICKWKNGKQWVECVNKGMIGIPNTIDSGTQVFDFSGNDLRTLIKDQFQKVGLVHLQKIFLSRCRLSAIDDRAFRALTNLVDLDLSNNLLVSVPVEVFADVPALMKLYLNGNPFKIIRANSFKNLPSLNTLDLSKCELEAIESDAFFGLSGLDTLKLDHNALKYIPGANTLPRRLHAIQLQHNPWFCDCKLADLYGWLNLTNLPQAIEATCDGPTRLRGAPIKQLDDQELACLPDVSPTSLYLEIPEGKNVSLLCRVNAQPEARISWHFQDRVLYNDSTIAPGVRLYYYYVEEGTIEKVSELFIFNTNVDDNGTFICVAENQAGKAQSNYTIRIVLREEPLLPNRKMPTEYFMGLCALAATVIAFLLTCLISCWLRHRVKRKKRRKKEKSKELVLYNDSNATASPITRNGETLSAVGDACMQKANGNIFIADQSLLKMNGTTEAVGNVSSVSHILYPCSTTFSSEPNPDLINDTSKERKLASNFHAIGLVGSAAQNDYPDPAYASISPRGEEAARSWTPSTINIPSSDGVRTVSVNVCLNHFQTRDTPLMSTVYPNDLRLAKVATHFPAVLPATAFYRTLPHKRHTAAASNAGAARYARDAELLTRSLQPASYEHFHSGDVRYNVEGYPKDSPSYTYHASSTPHVSFSDTVQILGRPSEVTVEPCKGVERHERQIQVALTADELVPASKKAAGETTTSEGKLKTTSKLSIKVKSKTDSPDEGYVGECADTTEV